MSWKPLIGHERPLERLRQAARRGRLGHAYLFVGPEGIGKRRLVRHVAQGLLCERQPPEDLNPCGQCLACKQVEIGAHPDFFEAAKPDDKHELPIAVIQELCAKLQVKPARGTRKIAIVDDADLLNEESANCFLKTLEEPPPGSLLILIATSLESQLPTIVSRCQVTQFVELPTDAVESLLQRMELADDAGAARRLAQWSGGSVGMAVEMAGEEWRKYRERLIAGLAELPANAGSLADETQKFIDAAGEPSVAKRRRSRQVVRLAVDFFRLALRVGCGVEPATGQSEPAAAQLAQRLDAEVLLDLIDRCLAADYHIGRYLHQSLAVECWIDDLAQIAAGQYVPTVG